MAVSGIWKNTEIQGVHPVISSKGGDGGQSYYWITPWNINTSGPVISVAKEEMGDRAITGSILGTSVPLSGVGTKIRLGGQHLVSQAKP